MARYPKLAIAVGVPCGLLLSGQAATADDAVLTGAIEDTPSPAAQSIVDTRKPRVRVGTTVLAAQPRAISGSTLWANDPVNGVNGYSNGTVDAFGTRRTLLDDFDLASSSELVEMEWNSVWGTIPGGIMGTGAEISIRSDVAGTPGAVITTPTIVSYLESLTGNMFFSRNEVNSFVGFDPVQLPAGRYWFEATVVGPENNFWLTSDQLLNECWVNYDDEVPPLRSGTTQFDVASDVNFTLYGFPIGACCVAVDCTLETLASCIAMGGEYQGDHTDCSTVQCLCPLDEHFDIYALGSFIGGQGGWEPWDGIPANGEAVVTNVQALSAPHSILIEGGDDIVQQFAGLTSGQWIATAHCFVPGSYVGDGGFVILNEYDIPDGAPKNWSTQVRLNSSTGSVESDFDGSTLPLIRDQWVEIRVEIDLDNDSQSIFYGGDLLVTKSWTEGVSGGGMVNIAAINPFANPDDTGVFWDDISLCQEPINCTGDANNSGTVDFQDILVVLANWGGPYVPCPPYKSADVNRDCSVNFQDILVILSNWGPCPVQGIVFTPTSGTVGDILTITGTGFDPDPDDNCVALVRDNQTIGLTVLSATETQLLAHIDMIPPNAVGQEHQLMVGTGDGERVTIIPDFPDVVLPPNQWIWRSLPDEDPEAQTAVGLFTPTAPPAVTSYHSGPPVDGRLCVVIDADWAQGAQVNIYSRVWTNEASQQGKADTSINNVCFTLAGSRFDCAVRICNLLVQQFAAHPTRPLFVNCTVTVQGGAAKITVTTPPPTVIEAGQIDIIVKGTPAGGGC